MNQLPLRDVGLSKFDPSGLIIVMVLLEIVLFVVCRLKRCPVVPSKTRSAIRLAAFTENVFVSPNAIRPAKSTLAAVKGEGGTKKSPVLVALPAGVVSEIRPEVAPAGTVVLIVLDVAAVAVAVVILNLS